jgi:hypothetical protein
MSLNFPNDPEDGQIFDRYFWDNAEGVWKKRADIFVAAFSGTSPPENPQGNELWFNTANAQFYVYYEDQDSSQWVQLGTNTEFDSGTTPVNFPSNPSNGEAFNGFVWNESLQVWQKQENVKFFIGNDPPPSPLPGDVWFNNVIGIPALYYDDGISQQWVEIGGSKLSQ